MQGSLVVTVVVDTYVVSGTQLKGPITNVSLSVLFTLGRISSCKESWKAATNAWRGDCQSSLMQYSLSSLFPEPAISLFIARDTLDNRVPMKSNVIMTYNPKHAFIIRGR